MRTSAIVFLYLAAICMGATGVGLAQSFYYDNHYYTVVHGAWTWFEARDQAVDLGGHLVVITSQPEQDFLEDTVLVSSPEIMNNQYWIGAYSSSSDPASWRWVTGEWVYLYTNWEPWFNAAYEPNHVGVINQEYSVTGDPQYLGMWSAEPNDTDLRMGYIMESDAPPVSTEAMDWSAVKTLFR